MHHVPLRSTRASIAAARPARSRTGGGRRLKRFTATLTTALLAAAGVVAIAPPASADLGAFGPEDPQTLFPAWYRDQDGLALQLCQEGPPYCLSGPESIEQVHAAGGDAESFYWVADATAGPFTLHLALEAAYAGDGAGMEAVFQRTQLTARDGGLTPGDVYTIKDPFGTFSCTIEGDGTITQNGCRLETSVVEREFGRALTGTNARIGPFLTWDTFGTTGPGAPPAGYIGDFVTPHRVTGSPTGFNRFRVTGPALTGTCTDTDGSVITQCAETELFTVQGKVAPGISASISPSVVDFGNTAAAVTKTVKYAATGSEAVNIQGIALSGSTDFTMSHNCPIDDPAAATNPGLAPNSSCTITATYTPTGASPDSGAVTITDTTPAGTRTISLSGASSAVATTDVSSLNLGSTPVGQASTPAAVTVTNTGSQPLTVTGATIAQGSPAHFRVGRNFCTAPVVRGSGGCEIEVVFAPQSTGTKTGTLNIVTNGGNRSVALTGNGTPAVSPTRPSAPFIGTATAGVQQATVNWSPPAANGGSNITGYKIQVFDGAATTATRTVTGIASTAVSAPVNNLTAGRSYTFKVIATNGVGDSVPSDASNAVTPTAPAATAPAQVTGVSAARAGSGQVRVAWGTPASNGSAITSYRVEIAQGATSTTVVRSVTVNPATVGGTPPTNTTVTGLTNGTTYRFRVRATNGVGTSGPSAWVNQTPATTPNAPTIAAPTQDATTATGVAAVANWTYNNTVPTNGGTPVTGFIVRALRFSSTTATTPMTTTASAVQPASARRFRFTGLVAGGIYRFTVVARNAVGDSPQSARSGTVIAR